MTWRAKGDASGAVTICRLSICVIIVDKSIVMVHTVTRAWRCLSRSAKLVIWELLRCLAVDKMTG